MGFDKVIHMGNGDESLVNCYKLQTELNDALTLLSAFQQGARKKTELKRTVDSIVTALLGRDYAVIATTCPICKSGLSVKYTHCKECERRKDEVQDG